MKNKKQENLSRYSQKPDLDPAICRIVTGIKDGGTDAFHTRAFSREDQDSASWLEAWKGGNENSWTVEQYDRVGGAIVKNTVLRAACFFDALYYCAAFETREKMAGLLPAPEQNSAGVHYSEAAKAACQPLDLDGMPLPAANGRILVDGIFDESARDLAAQTKGRTAQQAPDYKAFIDMLAAKPSSVPAPFVAEDRIAAMDRQRKVENKDQKQKAKEGEKWRKKQDKLLFPFCQAAAAAADVDEALKNGRDVCEKIKPDTKMDPVDWVMAGILSPILVPVVAGLFAGAGLMYCANAKAVNPGGYFRGRLKRLESLAAKLPDNNFKTLTQEFAAAANNTFYLEAASIVYKNFVTNGKKSPKDLKEGVSFLKQAAQVMKLAPADEQNLINGYLDGNFPAVGSFHGKLALKLKAIQRAVADMEKGAGRYPAP